MLCVWPEAHTTVIFKGLYKATIYKYDLSKDKNFPSPAITIARIHSRDRGYFVALLAFFLEAYSKTIMRKISMAIRMIPSVP